MLHDLYLFLRHSLALRSQDPQRFAALEIGSCYTPWVRSLAVGAGALTDHCPWLTLPAIRFLERVLTRDSRVFEYGAGGSTLFFAERARSVHSVEHDAEWTQRVRSAALTAGLDNATVDLAEPTGDPGAAQADPADPDGYTSSDPRYAGRSFRDYAARIDDFADGTFDLILVDGRARPACLVHALSKVRVGGHLMLDNSDRDHYQPAMARLSARMEVSHLPGPTPYLRGFTRTTVWRRRAAARRGGHP